MAMEVERRCPRCEAEKDFYRTASMHLHLGQKTKWACPDCEFKFVRVNGTIDTGDPE